MNKLIDISGCVEREEDLMNIQAVPGEFYNVLNPAPFLTFRKTEDSDLADLQLETDIIGWFENKAELLSNVPSPNIGDVYITGSSAPFTRWKANILNTETEWFEDGESDIKILKKFLSPKLIAKSQPELDPDIYYSVGKAAPYKVFGTISSWECIGMYISHYGEDFQKNYYEGFRIGEVAYSNGMFYLYSKDGWNEIKIIEPFENFKKHIYKDHYNDRKYSIREGFKLGTLEFFEPKELQ